MVKRFLGKPNRHVVTVGEFSEASVVKALQQLTDDIRDRLGTLVRTDVFEVEFKVGQKTHNEIAFFKRVSREKLPVAVALRNLLTTYLAVQPAVLELKQIYRQIWGPERMGALGSAMGALLKLDPHAHDVFRNYLAQRNGEYETYSTDVLMAKYVKENGWPDESAVRFGIYFALLRERDGRTALAGGLLNEYGLVDAVKKMISADEFGTLIMDEVDQFARNFRWNDDGKSRLYQALQPSLETGPYEEEVLEAVASKVGVVFESVKAEDRGWNRDFLTARRSALSRLNSL